MARIVSIDFDDAENVWVVRADNGAQYFGPTPAAAQIAFVRQNPTPKGEAYYGRRSAEKRKLSTTNL